MKYVPKADKALDYSLKFQELEDSSRRKEEKLETLPKNRNLWLSTLSSSRMSC